MVFIREKRRKSLQHKHTTAKHNPKRTHDCLHDFARTLWPHIPDMAPMQLKTTTLQVQSMSLSARGCSLFVLTYVYVYVCSYVASYMNMYMRIYMYTYIMCICDHMRICSYIRRFCIYILLYNFFCMYTLACPNM